MKEILLLSITQDELKVIIQDAIRGELDHNNSQEPKKFLCVEEAAIYLKTTKSTLYKMTSDRKIPFYKPTKKLLFKKSELDDWISNYRIMSSDEIEAEATNYINRNRR